MKVVILAGGFGTRLSEYTRTIPKPMVKILGVPIIVRIINFYRKFGFKHIKNCDEEEEETEQEKLYGKELFKEKKKHHKHEE